MSVEAFFKFARQPFPFGGGAFLFDHLTRLIHIGRAFFGVVAVSADEMQQIVVDHFQRQLARTPRGERFGIALKVKGLIKKLCIHITLLDGLIALYMREHDMQIMAVLQGDKLVKDPV